jgi:S-methylmethionine-dependent homocysteine/selenocysteine methylase
MIVLDGAMGSELERRGVNTALPLWSAAALDDAPEVVERIHNEYLAAGAQVITANTFRTNVRALAKASIAHRARELTHRAVALARRAAQAYPPSASALVAGSIAPVEDCYAPALVPSDDELLAEHTILANHLAEAGVDLLLVETQNTIREAVAALRAARATGKPVWVSFTLNAENHLLSGEPLSEAVRTVLPWQPQAVLVNCIPVAQVASVVKQLRALVPAHVAIGAYANAGRIDENGQWTMEGGVPPDDYAKAACEWRALGATIIGGCCGTTPAHIAALVRQLSGGQSG